MLETDLSSDLPKACSCSLGCLHKICTIVRAGLRRSVRRFAPAIDRSSNITGSFYACFKVVNATRLWSFSANQVHLKIMFARQACFQNVHQWIACVLMIHSSYPVLCFCGWNISTLAQGRTHTSICMEACLEVLSFVFYLLWRVVWCGVSCGVWCVACCSLLLGMLLETHTGMPPQTTSQSAAVMVLQLTTQLQPMAPRHLWSMQHVLRLSFRCSKQTLCE